MIAHRMKKVKYELFHAVGWFCPYCGQERRMFIDCDISPEGLVMTCQDCGETCCLTKKE